MVRPCVASGIFDLDTAFGDLDRLAMDIRAMDPKWRDQEHSVVTGISPDAGYQMSEQPG